MRNKEFKPSKPDDNENVAKAINILDEVMELNPQIEQTLWCPAFIFVLIRGFKYCGFTYEEFRNEVHQAFEHYKGFYND